MQIIVSCELSHPLRVAIDGIDNAGKTSLADELSVCIEQQGRPVIRASIDGFHRPRRERYQRGSDSPEGYYEDSFDYTTLRKELLIPLGPNGNLRYRRAAFDVYADAFLTTLEEVAPSNAILLFDGVFLLRHEIVDDWDYKIFVDVAMDVALQRAIKRGIALFGSAEAVQSRYLQRYLPGQKLYLATTHPEQKADVIVKNNDPASPYLFFPPMFQIHPALTSKQETRKKDQLLE